jgi:hypothetical protein
MDVLRYRAAAALAGPALLRARPSGWPIDAVPGAELAAVYIVCDITGTVLYVGSTCGRPARRRLAEHLADTIRTRRWHEAWIVPLRSTTPPPEVRRLEGVIGRYLRPTDNGSLPAA